MYHIFLVSEFRDAAQHLAADMLPNGKIRESKFYIAACEINPRSDPVVVTNNVLAALRKALQEPSCVPSESERKAFVEEVKPGRSKEKPLFLDKGLGEDGRGLVLCVRLKTTAPKYTDDPRYKALIGVIKANGLEVTMEHLIGTKGMSASYGDDGDYPLFTRSSDMLPIIGENQIKATTPKP